MNCTATQSQLTFLTVASYILFHGLSETSCLPACIKNSGSLQNNSSYLKRLTRSFENVNHKTKDTLHFKKCLNKTRDSGVFVV